MSRKDDRNIAPYANDTKRKYYRYKQSTHWWFDLWKGPHRKWPDHVCILCNGRPESFQSISSSHRTERGHLPINIDLYHNLKPWVFGYSENRNTAPREVLQRSADK